MTALVRRYGVPCAAGVLLAAPTLIGRFPPMGDLPLHEAIVGLASHTGDATFAPPGMYLPNIGHPNQLWYALSTLLAYGVGSTWACKIIIAASIFLIPLSAAFALAQFGRHTWASLLLAPLALGWLFYTGLVTNLLGLSLFLCALGPLHLQATAPTRARTTLTIIIFFALYTAHESSLVAAALAYCVFSFAGRKERPWFLVRRALPLLVVGALCIWQVFYQRRFLWGSPGTFAYRSLLKRLAEIPEVLVAAHPFPLRAMLIAAPLLALLRSRTKIRLGRPGWKLDPLDAVAVALFVAFLVVPDSYHQHTRIAHRFLPMAWAVFLIARAPPIERTYWRLQPIFAGATTVATVFVNAPHIADADRVYRELDELIDQMVPGQAVVLIETSARDGRMFSVSSAHGHIVARRGGRLALDFTDLPTGPLRRNPDCRWPISGVRFQTPALSIEEFRAGSDFRRFGYMILHATDPRLPIFVTNAMQGNARLVNIKGEWSLYESTHSPIALCARDTAPAANEPRLLGTLVDVARSSGFAE